MTNLFNKIFSFSKNLNNKHSSFNNLKNEKFTLLLFSAIENYSETSELRYVGGCIRKILNNETIDDIDFAVNLKPNECIESLKKHNIKYYETGIEHGTVTAIIGNKKFEITSLRKDISTDGRHAKVIFSTNWEEDALRRDFTINAVYADIEGQIFDPFNGISDLQNGVIKFIGTADERIQEDYLRILRYFRFFTQYSKIDHNQDVIKSIKKYINGLNKVSNERIFDELNKIIVLENLLNLFFNKTSKEIIINIFPQLKYYERLKIFNTLNHKLKYKYDINLIFALLLLDESNDYEYFCHKYKTSNIIKSRFKNISINFENFKKKEFYLKENIKKLIYLSNKNDVRDLLLFSICANNKAKTLSVEPLLDYVNTCKIPKFPFSGDYLMKHGYETGQALGKKLKSLEEKWVENNFVIDKKIVEKSLGKVNKN